MNAEEYFYSKVYESTTEYSCFGKEHDEYLAHMITKYMEAYIKNLATPERCERALKEKHFFKGGPGRTHGMYEIIHIGEIFETFSNKLSKVHKSNILCLDFYNNYKILPILILAKKIQENISANEESYKKLFEEKLESEVGNIECLYFSIYIYEKELYEKSYDYFKLGHKKNSIMKGNYDITFHLRNPHFNKYNLENIIYFYICINIERVVAPAGSLTESSTESGMLSLLAKSHDHTGEKNTEVTFIGAKKKKGIISRMWLILKSFFGFNKKK
jgi:hypothetical protein